MRLSPGMMYETPYPSFVTCGGKATTHGMVMGTRTTKIYANPNSV